MSAVILAIGAVLGFGLAMLARYIRPASDASLAAQAAALARREAKTRTDQAVEKASKDAQSLSAGGLHGYLSRLNRGSGRE